MITENQSVPQRAKMSPAYPSPPNSPDPNKSSITKAREHDEKEPATLTTGSSTLPTPITSPSRNFTLPITKGKQLAEERPWTDFTNLKEVLGLQNSKCGSPTKENRPCRKPIKNENKNEADLLIKSMVALTQSSSELEAQLNQLATLVHCHCHDYQRQRDTRVEAWTEHFPSETKEGEENTKLFTTTEKRIRRALGKASVCCSMIEGDKHVCKEKIGGQRVANRKRTIDEIVKPEVYLHDKSLQKLLEVLACNIYCSYHPGFDYSSKVSSWKLAIMDIRTEVSQFLDKNSGLPEEQCSSISTGMIWFDRDPEAYWPKSYDNTPFEFVEPPKNDQKSDQLVQMKKPLAGEEWKKGYVYMYEVGGNEGYVKIGYTSRSVEQRHQEWEFDCNREVKSLYPTTPLAIAVPNAARVEALCHAELHHCRFEIYCHSCLGRHTEWFKVSPEEATRIIKKWSRWMALDPYKLNEMSIIKNQILN